MREKLAKTICALVILVVTGLSILFAFRHNPTGVNAVESVERTIPSNLPPPELKPGQALPGRLILEREKCLTCHSVAGQGNPRSSLDGIGARLQSSEIEEWIKGTGGATNKLKSGTLRRKARYQRLAEEEMSALVSYLSGLTNSAAH